MPSNRLWPRYLGIGAIVAGTCDITYATTYAYLRAGMAPTRLLQFVASGALGQAAFDGGVATAALGLGFHFLNAFIITTIFFVVAARVPALRRNAVPVGISYGLVVYCVMTFLVVPWSRIGPRPFPATLTLVTGLLVHMFLIGLPVALAARRAFPESAP